MHPADEAAEDTVALGVHHEDVVNPRRVLPRPHGRTVYQLERQRGPAHISLVRAGHAWNPLEDTGNLVGDRDTRPVRPEGADVRPDARGCQQPLVVYAREHDHRRPGHLRRRDGDRPITATVRVAGENERRHLPRNLFREATTVTAKVRRDADPEAKRVEDPCQVRAGDGRAEERQRGDSRQPLGVAGEQLNPDQAAHRVTDDVCVGAGSLGEGLANLCGHALNEYIDRVSRLSTVGGDLNCVTGQEPRKAPIDGHPAGVVLAHTRARTERSDHG